MTTLKTRIEQIQTIERFRIRVRNKETNKIVPLDQHGFKPYRNKNALPDAKTVSDYVARFERAYPGFTCDVGERKRTGGVKYTAGHGNRKLKNLRASYL